MKKRTLPKKKKELTFPKWLLGGRAENYRDASGVLKRRSQNHPGQKYGRERVSVNLYSSSKHWNEQVFVNCYQILLVSQAPSASSQMPSKGSKGGHLGHWGFVWFGAVQSWHTALINDRFPFSTSSWAFDRMSSYINMNRSIQFIIYEDVEVRRDGSCRTTQPILASPPLFLLTA